MIIISAGQYHEIAIWRNLEVKDVKGKAVGKLLKLIKQGLYDSN